MQRIYFIIKNFFLQIRKIKNYVAKLLSKGEPVSYESAKLVLI